jgi:hypothetical protein
MKYQTGFDRLSKAHFIRKENSRRQTSSDLRRNVELMRYEIDAASDKSTHLGFSLPVLMFEGCSTKIECMSRVKLAGQQSFFGLVESDRIAQFRFANVAIVAAVEKESMTLGNRLYGEAFLLAIQNCVADAKAHASKRCVRASVFPLRARSWEFSGDSPLGDMQNRTQIRVPVRSR